MSMNYRDLEKKNIVILGAGFAGIRAALSLNDLLKDDSGHEIILVDKKDYHLYHCALYEVATTEKAAAEGKKARELATIPLGQIFSRTKVRVFKARVEDIDLDGGMVVTDSKILNYNYLLVALGSVADFNGVESFEKFAFSLKSLEDAVMIRNRISEIIAKKDSGRVIIAGAGLTGSEFSGEAALLVKHLCAKEGKDPAKFEILVVDGGTNFLPGFPENVSEIVSKRLVFAGVKSRFQSLITNATSSAVTINNREELECDLLVWAGGVKSAKLKALSLLERDKKDRVAVTEFLNLRKYPRVFWAGDSALVLSDSSAKPAPQTAYEAIAQGNMAAKNIFRMIQKKPLVPYLSQSLRFVIPLSGKFAAYYSPNLVFSGFFGWLLRRVIDLRYFLSILPFGSALLLWFKENRVFVKND
jgi:NADH:ubiquinone reductase (H+-translocating)